MIASSPRSNSRQRGLTLVELLIALTIGLFVVGAIGVLYVQTPATALIMLMKWRAFRKSGASRWKP